MKNEIVLNGWASEGDLARYDAVKYLEEAVKSGIKLKNALAIANQRLWNGHQYGVPTLERWFYLYREGGFTRLKRQSRSDKGQARVLAPDAKEALIKLRQEQPQLHVVTLLRELERREIVPVNGVSISTVYRVLAKAGLDPRSMHPDLTGPTKAFEEALVNELWMTDGMHGPALKTEQGKACRTYLLALIDDCSRLCTYGEYFPAENTEHFLRVLKLAVKCRGLPNKLYTDNGKLFTCKHLKIVCANLGINLIHAKPYAAWSKGKIERFFGTVQSNFQQRLVFEPAHSLLELNQKFWRWLEADYHQRERSELENKTPAQRFRERSGQLRVVDQKIDLDALFLNRVERCVRRDATITIDGRIWEVPVSLRGRKIEVHYDPFTWQRLDIYLDGQSVGSAHRCDKYLNSKSFIRENYARTDR